MVFPLTYYILPTCLVLYIIRKYREHKWGTCTNDIKLDGKVAIVTGANSGIGYEIAKELAIRNAQVILACRDLNKAKEALEKIKNDVLNIPTLVPMELDLTSLKSIKNFAKLIKERYSELHLLFNNAGVSYPKSQRVQTADGFEIQFGVNYLGHFYLTDLLLELLSKTKSRIVIISSSLHERGDINLDDLNSLQVTKNSNLYANSKLANIYFAKELAKRTKSKNISVYAVCPGWVYTSLFRHSVKWYHYFLIAPIAFFFMRSPKQGAQTPIYCATEPLVEKESGLIYRDCKHYSSKVIFYDSISTRLWEESEKILNKVVGNI